MAYQIKFTDPLKEPISVDDATIDESTSLTFPGRNTTGYGQIIGENFLHLLENFASNTAPDNPIQGQLWYDTTDGVVQLKVYDGTSWGAAGGLKKGPTAPSAESSIPGDLWTNTNTQQLYLFTGSGWILVGPNVSSGAKTGAEPEIIIDTLNNQQNIVVQYVGGERVAIISKESFVPKARLDGFLEIRAGLNLNSNYNEYFGVAEQAAALRVGTTKVAAENFLRSDVTSNTNFGINIRNNQGVSVGPDAQFTVSLDGNIGTIFNKTNGSSVDIRVNNNGRISTMIRVDSSERVGINKLNPQETLDVAGTFLVSGNITNTSATDSINTVTGAFVTAGGAGIAKNLNVGGTISANNLTVESAILPDFDLGADLGSGSKRFNRIYTSRIDGEFFGPLFGSVTGNVSGSASKLASSTIFELTGDITSNQLEFDGQKGIPTLSTTAATGNGVTATLTFATQSVAPYPVGSTIVVSNIVPIGYRGTFIVTGATPNSVSYANTTTGPQTTAGTVTPVGDVGNRKLFFTRLSETFIAEKPSVNVILDNDEILISRSPEGLKRIRKADFFGTIPSLPIGVIMPYAGGLVPQGWLLCDGCEVKISDFDKLFDAIKYTYGDPNTLLGLGTFRLPDMRGRFALGADNMNNGITVPQGPGSGPGWDPTNLITTSGGSANRVTDPRADINTADPFQPRAGGGLEEVTLQQNNLPDHKHDLRGNAGNPYFAYRNAPGTPPDTDALSGTGNPPENSNLGQYLGNSGGILTSPPGQFTQTPINVVNPFMAFSYIIYAGV
jgi:microcystin-dependent protein